MSASTITTRVQIREGEALAQEIARRRGALDTQRNDFLAKRVPALERELVARSGARAGDLAALCARCEAIEQHAPAQALAATRASLERALAGGDVAQARAQVEHVEQVVSEVLDQRVPQEVVFERVVNGLAATLPADGEMIQRPDGALQATLLTPAGGRMPIVAPRMASGADQLVDFGVGEAAIATLATPEGTVLTGCDARERLVDDACAQLREHEQLEIAREEAAAPRAGGAAASREQRAGA